MSKRRIILADDHDVVRKGLRFLLGLINQAEVVGETTDGHQALELAEKHKHVQDSYDLLTEREKEVLQLIAEGKTNKEVAGLLNLSPQTIESHRANLMQKLSLHSTADIILYAVRKRIIS